MTASPNEENGNLESVIPEDSISDLIDSLKYDFTSKLHLPTPFPLLDCGASYMRMSEYCACQTKWFVKADSTDQEGEGFNKTNRIEGDAEVHSQGEGEEEGGD